ncbi:MAG TPA: hypothetical protein VF519_00090 [Mycobacteriales bacterium]
MPFVVLDLAGGVVRAGGRSVPVSATPPARLRVGADGSAAVLRAVSFGERAQAVRLAASSATPVPSLVAALRGYATVTAESYDVMHDVVALVLAGAEGCAMPYADAALLVARAAGWDAAALREADAAEVDALAAALGSPEPADDGWTRLELAPASVDAVVERLAAALLARAVPGPREAPEEGGLGRLLDGLRGSRGSGGAAAVPGEPGGARDGAAGARDGLAGGAAGPRAVDGPGGPGNGPAAVGPGAGAGGGAAAAGGGASLAGAAVDGGATAGRPAGPAGPADGAAAAGPGERVAAADASQPGGAGAPWPAGEPGAAAVPGPRPGLLPGDVRAAGAGPIPGPVPAAGAPPVRDAAGGGTWDGAGAAGLAAAPPAPVQRGLPAGDDPAGAVTTLPCRDPARATFEAGEAAWRAGLTGPIALPAAAPPRDDAAAATRLARLIDDECDLRGYLP